MSDGIQEYIKGVDFVFEANRHERQLLWEKYHEHMEYKEFGAGYGLELGRLNDFPVFISLMKATINGKVVLWVEPTSIIVDWNMIDAWVDKNIPGKQLKDLGRFHEVVNG